MRRLVQLRRDRQAVAALEFAITAAGALAAIFGIVDAGLSLQRQNALDYATWRAARWAIVNGSNAAVPGTAASVAAQFTAAYAQVSGAAAPVATVGFSPDNAAGSKVSVAATQPYSAVTGLVSVGSLALSGSATLTIQN